MASPKIMCAGCGEVGVGIFNPLCPACEKALADGLASGEIGADPGIEVGGTRHGLFQNGNNHPRAEGR